MRTQLKTLLLLLLLSICNNIYSVTNEKPFTIPEIKTWKGGSGSFAIKSQTCITFRSNETGVQQIATQLSSDYQQMFGQKLNVLKGKNKVGNIELVVKKNKKANPESYTMVIGSSIKIIAPTVQGLYWGTRTLLQLSEQNKGSLPCGTITDAPDYPFRGLMIDCGRKFFPIDMLRKYVKIMAYYKMNALHIHLNDNGFKQFFDNDWNETQAAFRLECDTYPGLTARDGYYTKKEFIELQKLADSLHVEIIPEIDVPAHSLAFTHYKPEIASKEYGMDHLDLFNPETYTFLDGLFKEYLGGVDPVFRGKRVHIGTDEYSNKDQAVVEKFRYFTDRYIKYVESFGKQALVWGQQTHAKGKNPIKVKDVLMYAWSNDYSQPKEMIDLGYDLVSIPDRYLYIVPKAGYYYDYLNTEHLYKQWTPANINDVIFPERHPKIKGGMFAVWNDIVGNGISPQDVHYRVMPALQTLSTKMWTGAKPSFDYAFFTDKKKQLSEAPGVNYAGRYQPGIVLTKDVVTPNEHNAIEQIGWNYRISFHIEAAKEAPGTVLFSSPNAKFYLSDPISGLLGFSRDGYLNTFGYQFFPHEKAQVMIEGNREQTSLFINGKLVSELNVKKINFGKRGDLYYIRTVVFPLLQTGSFNSKITHLKVESLQ